MIRWNAIRTVAAAVVVLSAAATQAHAGLDFTDTFIAGNASSATATFNGVSGTAFNTANAPGFALSNGFPAFGSDLITVSSSFASGSALIDTAVLQFDYTGAFESRIAAKYDTLAGNGTYTMVIQMGSITVAAGSTLQLTGIGFREFGAIGYLTYNPVLVLDSTFSNQLLFINVPVGPGGINLTDRDLVQSVQLTFNFTGGSGTSFHVDAVANPEPGTLALFGLGLLGLAGVARSRRRRNRAAAGTAS